MEFNMPCTGRMAYIQEINLVIKLCIKSIGKKNTLHLYVLHYQMCYGNLKNIYMFKAIKNRIYEKSMHK